MSRKSVLITGCSEGGIGNALALEWNAKGYRVFATARKMEAMAGLGDVGIECVTMDVTDYSSLNAAKAIVEEKTNGKLDILVNNAGQGYTMPILDIDVDAAKKIHDVNVWGVVRTIQVFSSLVIAAEGTIVIIGSVASIMPYVFGGSYNASKAAVQSIADVLRLEMYPFNVKVINVCTGGVKTNLSPKAIQTYDIKLPENSRYLPIEAFFKKRLGYSNANAIPKEEYARQVVSSVNRSKRSLWLWKGYFAWSIWFLSTFFWRTVFDRFMISRFGLNQLRKILKEEKKSK